MMVQDPIPRRPCVVAIWTGRTSSFQIRSFRCSLSEICLLRQLQFGLQLVNALVSCCEQRRDVLGLKALGNVLRAIHVPSLDVEADDLFGAGVVPLWH